jgi:hypothetical protein
MIANSEKLNLPLSDFQVLETSPFTFYFTGSRYFNSNAWNSDWDFFTQNSTVVLAFLLEKGFTKITSLYVDMMTVDVYRKGNVDIQLVKDVETKVKARIIYGEVYSMCATNTKSSRTDLWNKCFAAVQLLELAVR